MRASAIKIEDGKIIEATRDELYSRWLRQKLENIMTFPEYVDQMRRTGCKVLGVL